MTQQIDFYLSSTQTPEEQSVRTVRVRLKAWALQSNPDVIYGIYVGYGGGGAQETGYFKLIQSTDAFYSRHNVEEGVWSTGEDRSRCWEVYPDAGDKTWTEIDQEQLGDEWELELLLFDPPMRVDASEADEKFDNDIDGASVFFPSVLAAMKPGYGQGNFYLLEGERNNELLAQLSRHWPLLTSFT